MREISLRIRELISIIKKEKSIGYTKIKKKVGISDPVLIKHLKFLRENNVIKYEKKGKNTFYSYNYENDNEFLEAMSIPDVITSVIEEISENTIYFEQVPVKDFCNVFEKKIPALLFYCALKSIFDKKNWIDDFNFSEVFEIIIEKYTRTVLSPDKLKKMVDEYFIPGKYSKVGEEFRKFELSNIENRDKDEFLSTIFDKYGKEFDLIEKHNKRMMKLFKNN